MSDRKIDEELGSTQRFQCAAEELMRAIRNFGDGKLMPNNESSFKICHIMKKNWPILYQTFCQISMPLIELIELTFQERSFLA